MSLGGHAEQHGAPCRQRRLGYDFVLKSSPRLSLPSKIGPLERGCCAADTFTRSSIDEIISYFEFYFAHTLALIQHRYAAPVSPSQPVQSLPPPTGQVLACSVGRAFSPCFLHVSFVTSVTEEPAPVMRSSCSPALRLRSMRGTRTTRRPSRCRCCLG